MQGTRVAGSSASHLLLDTVEPLSWAYAANGSLYYAYSTPVGEHVGEDYEMTRVDTATGRVEATHRFAGAVDDTMWAAGSLWVTTTASDRTTLWRLEPGSLRIRAGQSLPSTPEAAGIAGSLAVAGGHLWVGTGTLDRVSLRTGRVDRIVDPGHPGPVELASDRAGGVLLASLGYRHPTYIARLNPVTGGLLSELVVPRSNTQPSIGGVIGGAAWIENSLGTSTIAWRINLTPLRPAGAGTAVMRASRLSVQAIAGALWVTEPVGRDNLNYCASPVSGRPLVRLPLLRGNSVFLTADRTNFFYTEVPLNAHVVKLETAPISPRCFS